jgi:hypothetical protein
VNRVIRVGIIAASLSLLWASTALGSPPSPANPAGKMLGVVRAHGQASKNAGSGNLSYHLGPVMHTNTTYAIYWEPSGYSVSSGYESLINQFFGDVAAASGNTTNVYYSDTQYYDNALGHILYSSGFGGAYVDQTPFPASGCTDSYTSVCLTDGQIQTEVQNAMKANGWVGGTGNVYFVFTPKNVGSCSGNECAYSYYCAYHSWIGSGSSAILYANMPYAAWAPSACGSGQSPNGDDADSTINVISHEHNESITDPLGSAWYDRRGYEDGDKCAWNFGTPLGTDAYGKYNQVINGHDYYVQQEWSNHSSGCVLSGL